MASNDEFTYESDSGERDNPTVAHFENFRPVKRTIQIPAGHRALNREGRAICRIMTAHGWEPEVIGKIFGEGTRVISRAVRNEFFPADDVRDDYDHVGEDFKQVYPPRKDLDSDGSPSFDSDDESSSDESALPSLTKFVVWDNQDSSDSESDSDSLPSPRNLVAKSLRHKKPRSRSPPPPKVTQKKDKDLKVLTTKKRPFPESSSSPVRTAKKPRYESNNLLSTGSRANQMARRSGPAPRPLYKSAVRSEPRCRSRSLTSRSRSNSASPAPISKPRPSMMSISNSLKPRPKPKPDVEDPRALFNSPSPRESTVMHRPRSPPLLTKPGSVVASLGATKSGTLVLSKGGAVSKSGATSNGATPNVTTNTNVRVVTKRVVLAPGTTAYKNAVAAKGVGASVGSKVTSKRVEPSQPTSTVFSSRVALEGAVDASKNGATSKRVDGDHAPGSCNAHGVVSKRAGPSQSASTSRNVMALPAASPSEHAPQSEGVVGVDVTRRPVSPAFSLQPRTVESELPSKSAGMASQSILVEDHIVPTALENGDVIPSASDVAVTNDVALPPGLIPVLPDTIAVDNVEPIPATDPIPASTPGTPTTIETFFSNVMDLDLSRYLPLFKSRGLGSMGILQTIAGWEHGAMKEMLKELLLVEGEGGVFTGPVGLSPIEVLSVERAIRKLGAGAGGQA